MTYTLNPPYRWQTHGRNARHHLSICGMPSVRYDGPGCWPQTGWCEFRSGSRVTILVILHYLLKNNITFMGVMCRGNRGATASSQRVLHVASRPSIGGSLR